MGAGVNVVLLTGLTFTGVMVSTLAIDFGTYFTVQNQLQTAVDAAALAGAAKLPLGDAYAEEAALEQAQSNLVAGAELTADDLEFTPDGNAFSVSGQSTFDSIISKMMFGGCLDAVYGDNKPPGCAMTVYAHSKALPAARDTILVIDTSSSMDDLGNNRPVNDVKSAANKYIDLVAQFDNESVDRIGLVTFDQTGKLQIGLTSQQQSTEFATVKTKVSGITLFSGSGWNTNYEAGLKKALDELQAHGRPNAEKIIIFMTDGKPNLPAPPNYYKSLSDKAPIDRCTNPVETATEVKQQICNYTTVNGERVYSNCHTRTNIASTAKNKYVSYNSATEEPVCKIYKNSSGSLTYSSCEALGHNVISDAMLEKYQNNERSDCGQTYMDYMVGQINAQTDRAYEDDVTIHTIEISEVDTSPYASREILRRLVYEPPGWTPGALAYMTDTTNGTTYQSENYNASAIEAIYEEIAEDIHVRLTAD